MENLDGRACESGQISRRATFDAGGGGHQGRKKQVIDGPYAEGKEIVGGYLAIKASDIKEAIEIAKGCPIFDYDGITEVREVAEN